ncbi:MAG TPA: hypothetical protein VLG10_09345 [Methylomirabilota bacterium]|nr:hypothetical protein [Methylomirabilota bacterium]
MRPRTPSARVRKIAVTNDGRVIQLLPPAVRAAMAFKHVDAPGDQCGKCGSTFIANEPAFVHCYCCGNLARIAGASLLAQELFEMRSGLRLAS